MPSGPRCGNVGVSGTYSRPVSFWSRFELGEHRRRLLGPHHAHRHDRHARLHGRLHEAAAAEAAQAIAVLVQLLGALAALGEHQHQLLLVVQQAVHVGGVGGHRADLGQQHREARVALEEVLDRDVQRPRVRVLLADRLADHRRVGRQRTGVVGHQQRAAGSGHVLDPLHVGAEPVAVEEVHQRLVQQALDPLGAAPVGQGAVGLDTGQVPAKVVPADGGQAGSAPLVVRRALPQAQRRACVLGHQGDDVRNGSRRSLQHRASRALRSRPRRPRRPTRSFQGCTSVAASIPRSRAPAMFTGLSSTRTSMSSSTQRLSLSKLQCRSS